MKENEALNEHISIFLNVVDKLKEIVIELPNICLSIMFLYSKPENYEHFRYTVEAQDELPKCTALKINLLED